MNVETDTNVATDSQAMTEVALGLAMAFFAMMILAMMSMSVPSESVASTPFKEGVNVVANGKVIADGEAVPQELKKDIVGGDTREDNIIIFYQGRYLDTALQPLDVATLDADQSANQGVTKQYVLALSPNLSLSDVLIARSQISSPNLTITELDEAWMTRLAL